MSDLKIELIAYACVIAVLLGGTAGFIYLRSANEAAAFNRLTAGPKVTVWDAVWLDLRVEAR